MVHMVIMTSYLDHVSVWIRAKLVGSGVNAYNEK